MAMDKSAADSFVYAKASGMLARSYVGDRARQLFTIRSLPELWSFLFRKEVPLVPEAFLAKALEEEAFSSFIAQFKKLLENYSAPSEILMALLQFYDYENLKDMGASAALGEKKIPSINDISPFNILNYSKWPDMKAVTAGSSLDWYDSVPDLKDQFAISHRIDCQYVSAIWNAAKGTDPSCRDDILRLFREKFLIDNAVWALRLRIYYKMEKEEIVPLLAYSDEKKSPTDPLVSDVIRTLDWDTDSYDQWKNWRFSNLLNPHEDGVVWNADPRWISNSYKKIYVRKAYRLFHMHPFTQCPLVCWFIVKRNELDNIRTAAESLRLNIDSNQAMYVAGVSEV